MNFTATTALPYEHLERATAGLRAALQHQLSAAGVRGLQVWQTFVVAGRVECADRLGRTWYEYRATVESRRPTDCVTAAVPPSDPVPWVSG